MHRFETYWTKCTGPPQAPKLRQTSSTCVCLKPTLPPGNPVQKSYLWPFYCIFLRWFFYLFIWSSLTLTCKYDCCWRFPNMKIWQNYDKRRARWQDPIRIKLCTKSGKRLGGLIRRTKISSRWVGSLFMWLQWRWSWSKSLWWIWFSKVWNKSRFWFGRPWKETENAPPTNCSYKCSNLR